MEEKIKAARIHLACSLDFLQDAGEGCHNSGAC
jgi:hypothetical protein